MGQQKQQPLIKRRVINKGTRFGALPCLIRGVRMGPFQLLLLVLLVLQQDIATTHGFSSRRSSSPIHPPYCYHHNRIRIMRIRAQPYDATNNNENDAPLPISYQEVDGWSSSFTSEPSSSPSNKSWATNKKDNDWNAEESLSQGRTGTNRPASTLKSTNNTKRHSHIRQQHEFRDHSPTNGRFRPPTNPMGRRGNNNRKNAAIPRLTIEERLKQAEGVEERMLLALENRFSKDTRPQTSAKCADGGMEKVMVAPPKRLFPSVRECNAALATFGDVGQLLRGLRLFVKMRKSASLEGGILQVPAPTLVTYSTLMSRAVQLGKATVALRLWNLMTQQRNFFSHSPPPPSPPASASARKEHPQHTIRPSNHNNNNVIVPDVKSANILMNAHAKLGDWKSAKALLHQMKTGEGPDVPQLEPNIVTYNTLVDACYRARELDAGLQVLKEMQSSSINIRPDARTYTSLISTVARRTSIQWGGANDPDRAFTLLDEMTSQNIRPNAMTYCALIDVCGRCRRSDLALKGLRMMLRQKKAQKSNHHDQQQHGNSNSNRREDWFENEVGAWTAAIDACGKAGRLDTAIRLFWTMPKFGVQPNTVTCGCLTDCLLRSSSPRTGDTLAVLRYMKRQGIQPTEVMYTSLMTSAGRLVKLERQNKYKTPSTENTVNEKDDTKAIEVYLELMRSLMQLGRISSISNSTGKGNQGSHAAAYRNTLERTKIATTTTPTTTRGGVRADVPKENSNDSNALLLKVFLVFQEMKAVGAKPDVACYNVLLRACARAGDVTKARDTLDRMIQEDGLYPNDASWRQLLLAASVACQSDVAESTWDMAFQYKGGTDSDDGTSSSSNMGDKKQWKPSVDALEVLFSSYIRHASVLSDPAEKQALCVKVLATYETILYVNDDGRSDGSDERKHWICTTNNMSSVVDGLSWIHLEDMHQHQRVMLFVLRAAVSQCFLSNSNDEHARNLASDIVSTLDCLKDQQQRSTWDAQTVTAFGIAKEWATER